MRRKSERGKTKPVPKEESPEKASTRKTNRHHPRRRRKSSSSSGSESKSPKKDIETTSQPLEVQVQDIELPQEENPAPSTTVTNKSKETQNTSSENQKEWKEDNTFWESGDQKPAQEVVAEDTGSGKDKEGSSLWKIESANGAGGGGEIQKLKICRQRPTESPELVENPVRKRLSRGAKDGRSTDDSTHEESEKDTKQLKHRTRTSSRNSPLVSPTIVCDMSEGSPTKIKIINVSHINTENKGESVVKTPNDETVTVESAEKKVTQVKEDSHHNDTLDIALPADQPSLQKPPETNTKEGVEQKIEESIPDNSATSNSETTKTGVEKPTDIKQPESIVEDNSKNCSEKLTSSISSPKKEDKKLRSSRSSSADSDSSNNKSKVRKVKKKRRRELQSSVQRKRSSDSPKHESSDSEDGDKKREAERRGSTETQTVKSSDKENEADNSLRTKDNSVKESNEEEEKLQRPMPRKRRWGSSIANRANKKPILSISTDSLKSLIPDAKLVSAEELQLSVEEEEGQLDDDEEDDEVVIFVAKEEEKQLERERQRDEKLKEREKELEEKRKKKERLEKIKLEKPPPEQTATDSAPRKILLLTEDAKKLARSPSPPRHRPASVLYITHLVRPFTVQQLKNLLLRTGTITENGFWIDKIKSKCYVEYTTEDAAVETRHALHGVRWPTSNPKTLVVEFASHDDLVMAQALSEELPEVPRKAEPLNMVEGWVAEQARIKERTRRAVVREWDVGKPEHPDEVLEYDMKMKEKREQERKARKERPHRSATPDTEVPARKARRKEEDAPAKLLDDLFRKTKTSPCIYWLPLTQEQIAVKEEIRRQHMAEHERRMAELKKVELARRERERRNRK